MPGASPVAVDGLRVAPSPRAMSTSGACPVGGPACGESEPGGAAGWGGVGGGFGGAAAAVPVAGTVADAVGDTGPTVSAAGMPSFAAIFARVAARACPARRVRS
jgi:hypothetical protein